MNRKVLIILIILVLLAVLGFVGFTRFGFPPNFSSGGNSENSPEVSTVNVESGTESSNNEEPATPEPTPTPAIRLVDVVTAIVDIPIGQRIRPELIKVVKRPEDNIAVLAGVTFDDPEMLIGQIVKNNIIKGQEVLAPMIALDATDLAGFGSDLALYVDDNKVAIAFPVGKYSGVAYGMRPGDFVDMLMSLEIVEIDSELKSVLPNNIQEVDQDALINGEAFLFPVTRQGRLELIPEINLVANILPGGGQQGEQISRRVTQLTVQQAEVVWVGTWVERRDLVAAVAATTADTITSEGNTTGEQIASSSIAKPTERFDLNPDVIILSLPEQDALVLKWALERGMDIDMALRSQGDNSIFVTTSVTLPQLVEQGGLTIPQPGDYDLTPRLDEIDPPWLPAENLEFEAIP